MSKYYNANKTENIINLDANSNCFLTEINYCYGKCIVLGNVPTLLP